MGSEDNSRGRFSTRFPSGRSGAGVVLLATPRASWMCRSLKGSSFRDPLGTTPRGHFPESQEWGCAVGVRSPGGRVVYRRDLYRTRNMRLAFRDGFYLAGIQAALMTLTGGRFPKWQVSDAWRMWEVARTVLPAAAPRVSRDSGRASARWTRYQSREFDADNDSESLDPGHGRPG